MHHDLTNDFILHSFETPFVEEHDIHVCLNRKKNINMGWISFVFHSIWRHNPWNENINSGDEFKTEIGPFVRKNGCLWEVKDISNEFIFINAMQNKWGLHSKSKMGGKDLLIFVFLHEHSWMTLEFMWPGRSKNDNGLSYQAFSFRNCYFSPF